MKCTQEFKDRPYINNFKGVIRPFTDEKAQAVTIYKGWKGLTIPINGITDEEKEHNDSVAKIINEGTAGDVNGDGAVNVADISSIISYMTGDQSVDKNSADVNGDGSVDVADISAVITIMAGGE